ncbi:serine hydrolase domain-containing protein [Paenibacillus crassostreae]|uniref:Beta-lactamase-related domain-containing protein n=1 Tax=Paenibacillus crassostreae TaxID=1763538 RepID=A0A167FJ67_9BACL|nr:serine hydrolase domain-containing protein [Paenibacillus crassostreae]AOZ94349.1 hypothetical protein LPB68_20510 [Paenibacillus crassostreae]OAB76614.1 hypothetical protein PNBC_04230 [Paenibacillus crassostreae]
MATNRLNKLDKIFNQATNSKQIHQAVLLVENTSGDFSFNKGYGGMEVDSPMILASITKLFTTTCIFALQEQGKLSLDDQVTKYFDRTMLSGLHVYRGQENSYDLTLSELLFQTSGLPDVFEEGKASAKNRVVDEDFYINFDESVAWVKKLKPHFLPRTTKKAYYSDINFDMLGEIITKVNSSTLAEAYKQFIFEPLSLSNTYLPENEEDFVPNVYHRNKIIHRPKFIMSSGASGGCITTARELMIFIKAFFGGKLFSKDILDKLPLHNKLQASMGPIYYGSGYMRIPLSQLITMYTGKGELMGHSGSSGSFAFYYPFKDLYFVGDVNQLANASLPIRLTMKLAMMTK